MADDRNEIEGKPPGRSAKDLLVIFGPALIIAIAGFVVTWQFVEPAPPRNITIATGGENGAYFKYGKAYREVLAEEGINLKVLSTSGSKENVALLASGEVDVGFVQSGVGEPKKHTDLESIGSLYYEPFWVFVRSGRRPTRMQDLGTGPFAMGGLGSGTRAVAELLLTETGRMPTEDRIIDVGGALAAEALRAGAVRAAFFVASPESPVVKGLLADPGFGLMSFDRADAFAARHRFLNKLVLPEGVVDMERNLPNEDTVLLAPVATLVMHDDLHPALVQLLSRAIKRTHEQGGLFERAEEFPSIKGVDYPMNSDARRYIEAGPPFLQRFLPFWIANIIDRLIILLLPFLTLLIPLIRILPPVYRWRMRSKIVRWYKDVHRLEQRVRAATRDGGRRDEAFRDELDHIEVEVSKIQVPVGYMDMLYNLRLHIGMIRDTLDRND